MAADKIFLIGMMGSGKSYWAQKMAKWNKCVGYDLDQLIEMNEEKSIAEIFNEDGEDYFRKTEAKILRWFKEKKKFIIATGGGTPCFHENIQWMKKEGIVIWLDESVEVLVKRLSPEKKQRPLIAKLTDSEIARFIEDKLVERHAFYVQANYRLTSDQINEAGLKKLMAKHAS
ncbi:MAG: shikimate kinase [Chitinophagia bacterium]|jgi:shikimate kinase|nr:shikimate kinase [Chitinophagia bacterium]NCA30559.1 shikimate kinase [Chitinophagia bacterium]NDD15763.1 shikimate kinase [Chitinophagia bacterium]